MTEAGDAHRMWPMRALVVVAIAVAAFSALAAHAVAEDRLRHQGWAQTAPLITFIPQEGSLYVAVTGGNEEARTFIELDTSDVDPVAMRGARMSLLEADDGFLSDSALVAVCAFDEPLRSDDRLEGTPPAVDCTLRTTAVRDDMGEWTISLAIFAEQAVSEERLGLVLFPEITEPNSSFRIAYAAAKTQLILPPTQTPSAAASPEPTPQHDPSAVPDSLESPPIGSDPFHTVEPPQVPVNENLRAQEQIADRREGRSTVGSSVGVLIALAVGSALLFGLTPLRRRVEPPRGVLEPSRLRAAFALCVIGLMLLPMLGREAIVYKFGVVLIFFVAAIGLHVLVNWAGQLSLAHAGMVGLPAYSVLTLSELHDISPIYLLPVAVAIGAGVGAVVAVPTLRAHGLQVAVVTLLAGIAIDRYFFTQSWLVGSVSGRVAATPTLGPLTFDSSRSLYPILLSTVVLAAAAAWVLMQSKLARTWYWVRVNPEAASVFGVPVVTYRILAYAVGGAFAGMAGGLSVMWVQRLSPQTFPTTLSFTYLLIAVLAGSGFVGGLVMSTMVLQGGQQFASDIFGVDVGEAIDAILVYGGPVALISVITIHRAGFNGTGRKLMERFGIRKILEKETSPTYDRLAGRLSFSLIVGVVAIAGGFIAIVLAWSHASDTNQLWVQNQEMLSGGVGGLGAIVVGVGLLIRDRLTRNHLLLADQLERLLDARERADLVPALAPTDAIPSLGDAPASRRQQARTRGGHRTGVAE